MERAAARRGGELMVLAVQPGKRLWLEQMLAQATNMLKLPLAARLLNIVTDGLSYL